MIAAIIQDKMCTSVQFYFIFYHKKIVETVKRGLKIRPVLMRCFSGRGGG